MNSLTQTSRERVRVGKKSIVAYWSRSLFISLLSLLRAGHIVLHEGDEEWSFGSGGPCAHMTINDVSAYQKMMFGGSIGAGEAYVERLWDVDDLPALIRIMVRNLPVLDRMDRGFSWLKKPFDLVQHLLNGNSKRGAKRNILAHYDLGNNLYKSFLDSSMMYSAALYPHEDTTLEQAQQYKLEAICRKLDLQPSDSVLEIGTGWGGFALYAAAHYGCQVTTTTISNAQYEEAQRRVAAAGLNDKITVIQKDYRELSGGYDKLVSIEMVEAVGHRYLPLFFEKCGQLLKPGGAMLLQAITIIDQKYNQYARSVDFIQRYIFPGGCLLSNRRMLQLLTEKTDMVARSLNDFGLDYAKTIVDWRKRFHGAAAELEQHGYDQRFKRLWDFYLCYCLGGFLERYISVVHLVATRPEYVQRVR